MNKAAIVGLIIVLIGFNIGCIEAPKEGEYVPHPQIFPNLLPPPPPEVTPIPEVTSVTKVSRIQLATPQYEYPTYEELSEVLNTHHHLRGYERDVYDCSDMSINVARFLQEDFKWNTEVVGNYTVFGEPHGWVIVETSKDTWIAIETTDDPLGHLGAIAGNPAYYGGLDFRYEWHNAARYI